MKTLLAILILFSLQARAQAPVLTADLQREVAELKERVAKLEAGEAGLENAPENEELTKLRLEMLLPRPIGKRFNGFSPGMSQVYQGGRPEFFGGYGEIHYTSQDNGVRATNVTRLVPYLGYRFSNVLVLNSGFVFESGGAGAGTTGSVRVHHAYLDFLFNGDSGVRAGNVIVPFGLSALRYEPNLFLTVNRPRPEESIIPSTWNENGILGFGKIGSFHMQGGMVNGLNAAKFKRASWIREGRQFGANADAANPGWVFRVEHLGEDDESLGASFYVGDSAQSNAAIDRAQVTMASVHGEWRLDRFSAKALFVEGRLSDTDRIFQATGEALGSKVRGGYLILSYDLLPRLGPVASAIADRTPRPGVRELPIFISYEHENLEDQPTEGRAAVGGLKTTVYTFGANYRPHPQVVLKADFANRSTDGGATDRIIETAIGFVF